MNKRTSTHQHDSSQDAISQNGKSELNDHSTHETFNNRLLYRKMNEEMLHYTARSRSGY